AGRTARGLSSPRDRGPELPRDLGIDRHEREHAACAQALRSASAAAKIARHLRRVCRGMRRHMRHNYWIVRIFGIALIVAIFFAGLGAAVGQLWDLLMSRSFVLRALGFWQAVGLLSLSWILFGSWRGFPRHHGHWRHAMR